MRRIIGRDVFEGKPIEGEYTLTVHELGCGHREAIVSQAVGWEHVHTLTEHEANYLEAKYGESDAEAKREANLYRAARRAKTKVRRLVKSMGLNSLLTLTYRENVTEIATAKKHLEEFVRRVRRVLPGFAYVVAFERQQRGAWHMHLAVHRLPQNLPDTKGVKVKSWNVIRKIWLSVTQSLGGNIDEKKRKRWTRQSSAKLAGYLSKYMMKAFEEGVPSSHRYSASSHSLPEAVRQTFKGAALADLIALAYAFAGDGQCSISTYLSRFGDVFYIASESAPPGALLVPL
jgi:hypothetical protein